MRLFLVLVLLAASALARCDSGSAVPPPSGSAASLDSVFSSDPTIRFTYEQRRGRRIFDRYCTVCHGESGEGDGFNAFNLEPRPHDLRDRAYLGAISDASLGEIIAQGGRGVNKSVLMPAYGNTLDPRQIEDLVAYLRTLTADRPEGGE